MEGEPSRRAPGISVVATVIGTASGDHVAVSRPTDSSALGMHCSALVAIVGLSRGKEVFGAAVREVGDEMTERGQPLLVYVDSDAALRRLAVTTFRDEYLVESVAMVEDVHGVIEPAVAIINLSDAADPQPVWDRLTRRWPTAPAVVVLTTEAAIMRDRKALRALEPASIVVNPSPDVLRRGVVVALS